MKEFFYPVFDPLGAVWLLMVLCCLGLLHRRHWRSAAWLGFPIVLIFLLGSTPIIDRLVASAERHYVVSNVASLPPADAVVALGGGYTASPNDPLGFAVSDAGVRVLTAIQLTRSGKAPVLVLGGAKAFPDRPKLSRMTPVQEWIQAWRLTPGTVTNLGVCGDTHDEALRYAALATQHQWKRTLLVTSALHLKRAEAVFKKQGLEIVPVGCDFQVCGMLPGEGIYSPFPSQSRFALWSLYLHEQIGWWVYRWRGWI
jgi:uncharacterized SAM-binding protein YcdF (DUF218 family)